MPQTLLGAIGRGLLAMANMSNPGGMQPMANMGRGLGATMGGQQHPPISPLGAQSALHQWNPQMSELGRQSAIQQMTGGQPADASLMPGYMPPTGTPLPPGPNNPNMMQAGIDAGVLQPGPGAQQGGWK